MKLPDGKEAKNRKEYITAWTDKARIIEDLTDLKMSGFDPGILFTNKTSSITLPVWFITQIEEALDK